MAYACNVNKNIVGHRFMELGRYYTVGDFNSAYESFKIRYPAAYKYVAEHTEKDKWARVFSPHDSYNLDTSNSVESMKNLFIEATRWALILMLDCIIRKFSYWFNQRKDAVSGLIDTKLVPRAENYLHDLWAVAQKLSVGELDSYEYEVTDTEGKMFLASLIEKNCTCKVWDYENFIVCTDWLLTYISLQTLACTSISMSCAQNTTGRNCWHWRIPGHSTLCPTGLRGMNRITSRR